MNGIPFIGQPRGLKPQTRRFDGIEGGCVNADGIIEICRRIDTPEAKAVYQAFRRRLVEVEAAEPILAPEKQRQKAILAAIKDAGWNVTFTSVPKGAA